MKMNEKIKDKYFVLTMIFVIILIFALVSVAIRIIDKANKKNLFSSENKIYQYFGNEKRTYDVKINYEDNVIKSVDNLKTSLYGGTPVYIDGNNAVFSTGDLSIVFYSQNGLSYKLPSYHVIAFENDSYVYKAKNSDVINDFLLYDGKNQYLLFDETSVYIDDIEYKLSPFSFIDVAPGKVIIYNYAKDEYREIENYKKVHGKIDNIQIDFNNDALSINNNVILLQNDLNNLKNYKEN